MFKSNLYPEIQSRRSTKLKDKMIQIFIATAVGYIFGMLTLVYLVALAAQ